MAGFGGLCVFCLVPTVEGNSSVVRLVSSGVMALVTFCVALCLGVCDGVVGGYREMCDGYSGMCDGYRGVCVSTGFWSKFGCFFGSWLYLWWGEQLWSPEKRVLWPKNSFLLT